MNHSRKIDLMRMERRAQGAVGERRWGGEGDEEKLDKEEENEE